MRNPMIIAAVLAAISACGPAVPETEEPGSGRASADSAPVADTTAAPVELRTDRDRYVPGDAVSVTLVNRTDGTYAFNPCTRSIERETGGGWATVPEPQRICTMQAYILEPRQSRTESTEIPDTLPPGRYRLVIRLTREGQEQGEAVRAASAIITVGM